QGTGGGVLGLDLGADTFVPGDVPAAALLAHLRALARSARGPRATVVRADDLEIDTAAQQVRRGGRPVALTPREYAVLELLARHQGQPLSAERIAAHLYGPGAAARRSAVAGCLARLRAKIDREDEPPLILTRRGEGYL